MFEAFVIFSLAVVGSMVCLTADLAHRFVFRKSAGRTLATGPARGESTSSIPPADPVVVFGFVVACYGAIALTLVSVLPGDYALERTGLAFALLCVGGLIHEIANSRLNSDRSTVDIADEEDEAVLVRQPASLRLSVTLTLVLNLTFAVLGSGQGLIEIIPPKNAGMARSQELEPIVVVSERAVDPESRTETL